MIPLYERSPIWPELKRSSAQASDSPHWEMCFARHPGSPSSHERGALVEGERRSLRRAHVERSDEHVSAAARRCARHACGALMRASGDDVLFAHLNPDVVKRARHLWRGARGARSRALSEEKRSTSSIGTARRVLRPSGPARSAVSRPCLSSVQVCFDGTIAPRAGEVGLDAPRSRGRLRRTAGLLETNEPEARARVLADAVRSFGRPVEPRPFVQAADGDRSASDRAQLAQLDYWLAFGSPMQRRNTRSCGLRSFRT